MEKWMRTKVFVLVSVISVNVAASTTLKCIGHGENLYMNDSARYSSDDLIDRVPLKEKKTIYVVFGEDEMDVDGTTYRSNAYNSNNLYNSYDKGESEISGYKSFISFNYDDELTETFDVDRITGEFKSTIQWETSGENTNLTTYAEDKYGKGVDRIMIVKGTCKLSSKAF